MRVGPAVTSFNAGEFGELMEGRVDFARYPSASRRMLNALPLPQGPWTRRPGTRYVASVKSASVRSRLTRFEYSTGEAYILELANNAIRFFRNQARIGVADTDASITNGTFDSNITGWTDQSTGGASIAHDSTNDRMNLVGAASQTSIAEQQISIGASYRSTDHVVAFQVFGAPGDVVKVRIGSSSGGTDIVNDFTASTGYHVLDFNPATNASVYLQFRNEDAKTKAVDNISIIDDAPLDLASPWAEADLQSLKFAQNKDTLYCVRGSTTAIYRLERFGNLRWSLEEVLLTDGPYMDENTTATTLQPGAANGLGISVSASAVTGINDGTGFQSTDVGRIVRVYNGASSKWAWGVITAVGSTTGITVDHKGDVDFPTTTQSKWKLGEFSATTGYPSVVGFVQQRLGFAATTEEPQKIFLSQQASIEDFTPDDQNDAAEADDALNFRLAAEDVQTIVSLSFRRRLVVGTLSGEWSIESEGQSLAPNDIDAIPHTTYGVSETVPFIKARNRQLFVQRAGRQVYEFGYNFSDDAFQGFDLTVINDRVLTSGVREAAYAQQPHSIVWFLREDGVLAALTYQPEQEVTGWSRHIVGGSLYNDIAQVWQADDSAETFTDETTDANSTGNADWTVFPATEATGDYVAIGYAEKFSKLVFDYANGTAGVGGAVTWEYWNGAAWTALSGVTDNTTGFTAAAADDLSLSFTEPSDWQPRVLNAGTRLYYVRARITTVYTTNPVLDQGYVVGHAEVESVETIPGTDGAGQVKDSTGRTEVWAIVKRTIGGTTARYIEVFEKAYSGDEDDQEDAYYFDSIVTYDGASTSSISSGLDHLEGEVVKVWADGALHNDKTVSSGAITLDRAAKVVQVGLGYRHGITTMQLAYGAQAGSALGKSKAVQQIAFTLLETAENSIMVGESPSDLTTLELRQTVDSTGIAPLFSGQTAMSAFKGSHGPDPRIYIEGEHGPCTVLARAFDVEIQERM